jgi:hypothetical protein
MKKRTIDKKTNVHKPILHILNIQFFIKKKHHQFASNFDH